MGPGRSGRRLSTSGLIGGRTRSDVLSLPTLFHVEQCRFVDTFAPNC
jgi:hypothetical protein